MAIHKELTAKGNLIKNAEKVYPENGGDPYYSLCISTYDGKDKNGDFKSQLINFYYSGKYADQLFQEDKLIKGSKIQVRGEVSAGFYTNKRDGNIVPTLTIRYPNVVEVILVKQPESDDDSEKTQTTQSTEPDYSSISSDDIPF